MRKKGSALEARRLQAGKLLLANPNGPRGSRRSFRIVGKTLALTGCTALEGRGRRNADRTMGQCRPADR